MLDPLAWAVIERIVAGYRPRKIIVFGSRARGDVHEWSDLDLIVMQPAAAGVPFTDRIGQVLELCWQVTTELEVQPLVYTPEEVERMRARGNDFIFTALAEGVVVYEQESEHENSRAVSG